MKKYLVLIIILIIFCLFACKGKEAWDPNTELADGKSLINLEKLMDSDTITFAFYVNWKDIVKTTILDDVFEIIDKVISSIQYTPETPEYMVNEFLSKMSLNLENDFYNLLVAYQQDDPEEPYAFILLQGNFEGKHDKIIHTLKTSMPYPLQEKKTYYNPIYYTDYRTGMPAIAFLDDNSIMIAFNEDSLDWGLDILIPDYEKAIQDPVIREISELRNRDNTAWMIMVKPAEALKDTRQMANWADYPHLDNIKCAYATSKLDGKNSSESMILYLDDEDKLAPTEKYWKKYDQKMNNMRSFYPGLSQTTKNVTYKINKKNKSVSTEAKFDFDAFWGDFIKMANDMMKLYIGRSATR